jgi:hypothetical protein
MTSENQVPQETQYLGDTPKRKKPYHKPAFRYEKVFETTALSCGKTSATQASCQSSRKNS